MNWQQLWARCFCCCCPSSSVRHAVLLLSFCALSALFANLQLFNLVVLYTDPEQQQALFLPAELSGGGKSGAATGSQAGHHQPTVNWAAPSSSTDDSSAFSPFSTDGKFAENTANGTTTKSSTKKEAELGHMKFDGNEHEQEEQGEGFKEAQKKVNEKLPQYRGDNDDDGTSLTRKSLSSTKHSTRQTRETEPSTNPLTTTEAAGRRKKGRIFRGEVEDKEEKSITGSLMSSAGSPADGRSLAFDEEGGSDNNDDGEKERKKMKSHLLKKVKTRDVHTYGDEMEKIYGTEPAEGETEEEEEFDPTVEEYNPEEAKQKPAADNFLWGARAQRFAQSLVFSAPGIAIVIAHFPCYALVRRYGARKVVFAPLLASAAFTGAFPFILNMDSPLPALMLARIVLGLCVAPAFPFLGQMTAQWATIGEQLFFVITGFLALQFGPLVSWLFTTTFLRLDHPSRINVFGVHCAITLALALLWLLFYRDQPQKHQLVNGEELNHIVKGKPRPGRPLRLASSLLCLLLRSTSAWACWMAAFCYFFATLTLLIFGPVFLHKVLLQPMDNSLGTPFGLLFLCHLLCHFFGSSITGQNAAAGVSSWKVRLFNSTAFAFSALAFLALAILPAGNESLGSGVRRLWLLWLCLLPLGLCSLGFIKAAVLCGGGHFTQYIVAHWQLAFGLAYALVPTLLYSAMAEGSLVHWRLLFLACALLLLLGMAIFLILGRGTPTSWAEQWAEEAAGDAPLLMVKFSPIHQHQQRATSSTGAEATSPACTSGGDRLIVVGRQQ